MSARTVLAPSNDFARGDHVHITTFKTTTELHDVIALLISNAHIIIYSSKLITVLYGF